MVIHWFLSFEGPNMIIHNSPIMVIQIKVAIPMVLKPKYGQTLVAHA